MLIHIQAYYHKFDHVLHIMIFVEIEIISQYLYWLKNNFLLVNGLILL